jgi:formamidopyrimidine-DNA glycosylase
LPELPEVETSCRGIAPYVTGQRIQRIQVRQWQLRWPIDRALPQALPGQTIKQVARRGKYILLSCNTGTLILHLGMSGSLRLVERDCPLRKHDHVDLCLANQKIVRFNDPRRFGAYLWTRDDPEQHPLLSALGPEPLSPAFNLAYLWEKAQHRQSAIKTFIMDSHIVVGVGNIYANEALFLAGIKPQARTGSISRIRLQRLIAAIVQVLQQAITQGGTTLRDFINPSGQPGYFKQKLLVYGRAGQPCYRCGRELAELILGQRSSVYCTQCQR